MFTYSQAAKLLGLTAMGFSHRAKAADIPLIRGRGLAKLVSLETLAAMSGRTFTPQEIDRALAKPARPVQTETFEQYHARAMAAARVLYPGKSDDEIADIIVGRLRAMVAENRAKQGSGTP